MEKTIDYLIADPSGNITILVLSPVERADYQKVAQQMLDRCPQAEQLGYVLDRNHLPEGADPILPMMEMCGLEFCGNASRAFAYYAAMNQRPTADEISVQVSGCEYPLSAWIDRDPDVVLPADDCPLSGSVRIQMPIPTEMEEIRIPLSNDFAGALKREDRPYLDGQLVHMDGISHFIITDLTDQVIKSAGRDMLDMLFSHIRYTIYDMTGRDIPAFGTMFVDREAGAMTPIVYVRDVDTTYFEGSCASGSTAAAYAQAMSEEEDSGNWKYEYRQPAGTLYIDTVCKDRTAESMQLYGSISLTEARQMTVEV